MNNKASIPRAGDSSMPRELLEDELYETRQLLNLIMDNNPFAIFWKDRELVYRGCNHRFAEMSGFGTPANVFGKTDFEMPWGVDNEVGANACRSSDFRVIDSGLEEMHIIELIQQESGEELWTDTSKVPILDTSGKVTGVLGVLEDITQRKLIEQALADAHAKLEELSRIDALTLVANRRHFGERLDEEWARTAREGCELAVILFDIDHFKKFNDQYGHLAGDKCLTLVAEAAKATLKRPADFIARYGGEEFVVILPRVNAEGAQAIAEEIRRAVERVSIEHEGQKAGVTISLGVAVGVPVPSGNPIPLLSKADQALYQAKESGRNRVAVAAP